MAAINVNVPARANLPERANLAVRANARPNVMVRCCTHCNLPGHKIDRCPQAYTDGLTLHSSIVNIIQAYIAAPNNMNEILKYYLSRLTLPKLKILSYIHRDLNIVASNLYHNFLITLSQTAYRSKRDLVIVLTYYYKRTYLNLLLARVGGRQPDLEEQLRQFERPERNRPYGDSIPYPILSPRKFVLDTHISPSNKDAKFECPICYDDAEDSKRVTTNCNHDICGSCCDTYLTGLSYLNFKNPLCCMCRTPITSLTFTTEEDYNNIKNKLIV